MAKATPVPFGGNSTDHGEFHSEKFNIFEEEDMVQYSALRTKANDASSGVVIEQIREYTRKTTEREGSGEDVSVITTEDIYLVVQYWKKKPKRKNGESDDEINKAKKSWSTERTTS